MRQRRWVPLVLGLAVGLAVVGCSHPATSLTVRAAPSYPDSADSPVPLIGELPSAAASSASPSPTPSKMKSPTPKASSKKPPAATTPAVTPLVFATYGTSYTTASGGTGVVGPAGGTLKRYKVAVQAGLSESPAQVAATVDAILDNTAQGWLRGGQWRFQRVASGTADFIIELSTPATTDHICAAYGLHTEGAVSCRGGPNVVINLDRWENGTNGTTTGATAYSAADYRVLVINHEVGHALGHSHVTCPTAGAPAPVMMTQYYGLNGCTPTSGRTPPTARTSPAQPPDPVGFDKLRSSLPRCTRRGRLDHMGSSGKRLWRTFGAALLITGALTACGGTGSSTAEPKVSVAATTGAPTPTNGNPTGPIGQACTDLANIKQSLTDLQTAAKNADLPAGKAAWNTLTTSATDMVNSLKQAGSNAGDAISSVLTPITSNFPSLTSLASLTALALALKAVGPTLTSAIDSARSKLNCG